MRDMSPCSEFVRADTLFYRGANANARSPSWVSFLLTHGGMDPMSMLAEKHCVPCRSGAPPLKGEELEHFRHQLGSSWKIVDERHLSKTFYFHDFVEALNYVNQIAEIAEEEQHHPDIYLTWGKVRIDIWTHSIDGLAESDFVFAAKADAAMRYHEHTAQSRSDEGLSGAMAHPLNETAG